MSFDEALRAEMARRGMNQADAARHLNVSPQDVSFWVTRQRYPSKRRLPAVARFLRLPIGQVQEMVDREKLVNLRVAELEERMDGLEQAIGDLTKLVRRRARG